MNTIVTGFGWIELNGIRYEDDCIIHTNGSVTKRKKKLSKHKRSEYGHTPLCIEELDFIPEKPAVVYIGTGQYGALPITKEASTFLNQFDVIVKKTPEICMAIQKEERQYVAILHLTC